MIARNSSGLQLTPQDWQKSLSEAVTDIDELLELLGLTRKELPYAVAPNAFALRVPRYFVAQMESRNPYDPLLLQVLSLADEKTDTLPGFNHDPVGDRRPETRLLPGLLHKYHGRVLLTVTGACAVHCRYCFRRHFPYQDNLLTSARLQEILNYLQNHPEVEEVILSGGDPFSFSDQKLLELVSTLSTLPQLKRLRFHTRFPVVLPERITSALIHAISTFPNTTVVVLHANHPNEISAELKAATEQMHQAGILLLNQSVLLRGINDDAKTLVRLSERLVDAKVLPYYLNLLDKVSGSSHFFVALEEAKRIMEEMLKSASGYLVPRFVEDQIGAASKVPLEGEC